MSNYQILSSITKLFRLTRNGKAVGVIYVELYDNNGESVWDVLHEPDDAIFEIVKRAYIQRNYVDLNDRGKVLVTVHGIRTHADWNSEVSYLASASGWIVAPFVYGYEKADVLVRKSEQSRIIDEFRNHVYNLSRAHSGGISIIAHSFGTFITASYLFGFDDPPVHFDSWLICGSILNPNLDFQKLRGKTAGIYHEKAPEDEAVPLLKFIRPFTHELIGDSAIKGFSSKSDLLTERSCQVFTHNNVIRRDVIASRWLPYLESNVGKQARESNAEFVRSFRK